MNYTQRLELYTVIDRIVTETPINKFRKTLRGLTTENLEFIFSTDLDVWDDDFIVVKGINEHCIRSPKIRKKLVGIYNT